MLLQLQQEYFEQFLFTNRDSQYHCFRTNRNKQVPREATFSSVEMTRQMT